MLEYVVKRHTDIAREKMGGALDAQLLYSIRLCRDLIRGLIKPANTHTGTSPSQRTVYPIEHIKKGVREHEYCSVQEAAPVLCESLCTFCIADYKNSIVLFKRSPL